MYCIRLDFKEISYLVSNLILKISFWILFGCEVKITLILTQYMDRWIGFVLMTPKTCSRYKITLPFYSGAKFVYLSGNLELWLLAIFNFLKCLLMKVKVTINQTFLLVELPNTQLMMVAVLECHTNRAQIMGWYFWSCPIALCALCQHLFFLSSLFYSIVLVLHVALHSEAAGCILWNLVYISEQFTWQHNSSQQWTERTDSYLSGCL